MGLPLSRLTLVPDSFVCLDRFLRSACFLALVRKLKNSLTAAGYKQVEDEPRLISIRDVRVVKKRRFINQWVLPVWTGLNSGTNAYFN